MWGERFGIGRVPLEGKPGMFFGLSVITLMVIGIEPVRWFFAFSAALGLVIGCFFWLARKLGLRL